MLDEVKRLKNLNPKYLVIDEADKLFIEKNLDMKLILKKFK